MARVRPLLFGVVGPRLCRRRGWRIGYVLASPAAMRFVRSALIWRDVPGSDHVPVGVEVDPEIFG